MTTWLRRNGLLAGVVALLAAPFVVAIAWRLGRTGDAQLPVLDPALVELAVRDVGHAAVLVGPYSRYGFHHPGPLYFYLLAAPYRLFGSNYAALSIGSVLIGAASAFGIVGLSVRRGGRWLGVGAGIVVLTFLAAAGRIGFDAWTPWVTILPFALAIVLAWSCTCGDRWALPVLAGVATFLVQTHVAYGLPVGVITLTALLVLALDARTVRRDPIRWPDLRRSLVRVGAVTLGVLVVLWLPPVIDQLTNDPGNARELVSFFSKSEPEHTIGDGLDETARYLGALPAVVAGDSLASAHDRDPLAWPTVLTLLAFAAATFVAIRRRARDQLMLLGLTTLAGAERDRGHHAHPRPDVPVPRGVDRRHRRRRVARDRRHRARRAAQPPDTVAAGRRDGRGIGARHRARGRRHRLGAARSTATRTARRSHGWPTASSADSPTASTGSDCASTRSASWSGPGSRVCCSSCASAGTTSTWSTVACRRRRSSTTATSSTRVRRPWW